MQNVIGYTLDSSYGIFILNKGTFLHLNFISHIRLIEFFNTGVWLSCFDVLMHPAILLSHYADFTMSLMAPQITSISTVCSTVSSGTHQRKHQSHVSLAFVRGIHRWPVDSPHKGPITRKMLPFGDVIMILMITVVLQISRNNASVATKLAKPKPLVMYSFWQGNN